MPWRCAGAFCRWCNPPQAENPDRRILIHIFGISFIIISNKKISTHLLTVLTIYVIVRLEQMKYSLECAGTVRSQEWRIYEY